MNTWSDDITLIQSGYTTDKFGNQVSKDIRRTIQATRKNISRAEFYQAGQAGIRPSTMFVVHPYEYEDETKVEYNGKRYSVVRVYQLDDDELELYVERKINNE